MSTVLDEVTSEAIDATHIRRRVDDWEERLNGLYTTICAWLPGGWEARRGAPVLMHEKLMRKFGVAAHARADRTGRGSYLIANDIDLELTGDVIDDEARQGLRELLKFEAALIVAASVAVRAYRC